MSSEGLLVHRGADLTEKYFRFDVVAASNALARLFQAAEVLVGTNALGEGSLYAMRQLDAAVVSLGQVAALDDVGLTSICPDEFLFRASRVVVLHHVIRLRYEYMSLSLDARSSGSPDRFARWERLVSATRLAEAHVNGLTDRWLLRRSEIRVNASRPSPACRQLAMTALSDLHKLDDLGEVERMVYRGLAERRRMVANSSEMVLVALRGRVDFDAVEKRRAALHAHSRFRGLCLVARRR